MRARAVHNYCIICPRLQLTCRFYDGGGVWVGGVVHFDKLQDCENNNDTEERGDVLTDSGAADDGRDWFGYLGDKFIYGCL